MSAQVFQARASRATVMRMQGARVVIFNFLAKTALTCSHEIIRFLALLEEWKTEEELAAELPGVRSASVRRELDKLIALHAVVARGEPYAEIEARYLQEWEWGPLSGLLHFALRDNPCLDGET